MHKARSKLKWQRRLVRRGEECCGCASDSSSAEVFLKPVPFVSLFCDYVHPLAVLKAFCCRCTCASWENGFSRPNRKCFLSLSHTHMVTYLLLSFLSFWRSERHYYLTVSGIRCSAAANRQIERKHLTTVMDVSMNSLWWRVKWWQQLMWWESACVCLCVGVICHSCLHSLERCLSEWSPREETQQLMMLWCLNSEMCLWRWVFLLRTVGSEKGGRSCRGHGTTGLESFQ